MRITDVLHARKRKEADGTTTYVILDSRFNWSLMYATADFQEFKAKCKVYHDKYMRNKARRDRDQVLRDMGLTKVKGATSGRTYWE